MSQLDERLRPHPSARLSGPAVALNLPDLARALQAEPHPSTHGHRQAGLIHRGPLRLVLFAFEAGGELPEHRAPGYVVIHCLRGALDVEAAGSTGRRRERDAVDRVPRSQAGDRVAFVLICLRSSCRQASLANPLD